MIFIIKNGNFKKKKSETISNTDSDLRWNFKMGLLHGIFFYGGQAFGNPDTVLPVFLNNFTGSKTIIGLSSTVIGSLGGIGNVVPQLFVANKLESKLYKRPLLRFAITLRALCWAFLSLTTFLFAEHYPHLIIFLLLFFLLIFTFMGGVAVVPFYDIWAKSLPSGIRGRFFGHRQLWGGITAIGSGYITKIILGNDRITFPDNYALLFLFAFIMIGISYLALGSVREPVQEVHKDTLTFKEFLRKAFNILKKDKNYGIFLYVQILGGVSALALPFYVLYARDFLEIKLDMVGIFLMARMVGGVISNIIWAYISDFAGNKKVIQISTFLGFIIPLIAFFTNKDQPVLFIILFVIIGFFIAGRTIGKNNFLLDIATPKDRPTYISLSGTLTFPVMFFPLLGGILIQHISYKAVFLITSLAVFGGFLLSFWLKEPRKKEIPKG